MAKAHLIFTQHRNSYSVRITNLEHLSVEKIQELQKFVSKRNGIFNFEAYTFSVQKKMEFYQFESLIKHLEIDSVCEEYIPIIQTQPRVGFGQYKGMQYNELPDSYMLWLKTNYRGYDREKVDNELKKRKL